MELQAKYTYVYVLQKSPSPTVIKTVCLGKRISYKIDDLQQLKNMSVHGYVKLPKAILQTKLNLLLIYR